MNGWAIVDSHVHFWDPAQFHYPWLAALPTLNHAFLPTDFAAASAKTSVSKLVFVESGCESRMSLAEVDWISDLTKAEPRIKGIVAHASLEKGEAIQAELKALSTQPLVKGVRRLLQAEPDLEFCLKPEFVAGVNLLAEFGFTFDLCVRHEQLADVAELVRRVPQVMFVLDHCGKPDIRGRRMQPWTGALKALAALPNVVCKISGLTTEADCANWKPTDLKNYFETVLESFGFDRVLFGSDWPVATLATDYERWVTTVREMILPSGEANKLFQTNAERIYRV